MKQSKKSLTLKFDKNVHDQLVTTAVYENRSVTNLVETLLLQKLAENNFETKLEKAKK